MASYIEDYALLSDMNTGALVSKTGSIDWFCAPRFDSGAVFAALLGEPEHGRWLLAPLETTNPAAAEEIQVERSYRENSFILQTIWHVGESSVRVTDFMPLTGETSIVRSVEGLTGELTMVHELSLRLDYGKTTPWATPYDGPVDPSTGVVDESQSMLVGMAGPHALAFRGSPLPQGHNGNYADTFSVAAGQVHTFSLSYFSSNRNPPAPIDYAQALTFAGEQWSSWSDLYKPETKENGSEQDEIYRKARLRSLLVLRALISRETGGLVAALTTSLPEVVGQGRNLDFRFAWLSDSAQAMEVTYSQGHERETAQLRNWILRAVANAPQKLQSVYGVAGETSEVERRLSLPGYEGSQPVRVGHSGGGYFQGNAVGQVLSAFASLRRQGVGEDHLSWPLQKALLNAATEHIGQADKSVWATLGEPAIYTHSQVMLWAAFDAGVSAVRDYGLAGDADTWEQCRDYIAQEIMEHGFNADLNSFVQVYDGVSVDASLLQLAQVGFVDWSDSRMLGTVARIERELQHSSGMIYRYINRDGFDGFEGQDNPYFCASLWLAEQYIRSGRQDDGRALLDTVLARMNDLGLMSSEYDFDALRMTGNFPHTMSHIALVRAVEALGL